MILVTKRIKRKEKFNKLSAVTKGFLAATILALIPVANHSSNAMADLTHTSDLSLGLNMNSEQIIVINETKSPIVVGESIVDRDARLASEQAAAAAKAAADAKAKQSRTVISREYRAPTVSIPENIDLIAIYQSAAATYGIADWRYLKAIHYVETGCDISGYETNASGATGPMQFLPSTWRNWGVDGNGDGVADIHNVIDAIYGAAHYLAVSGGSTNIRQALFSYNHSTSYVNKVTAVAMSISQ
jgi:SLT domain-containing protein